MIEEKNKKIVNFGIVEKKDIIDGLVGMMCGDILSDRQKAGVVAYNNYCKELERFNNYKS